MENLSQAKAVQFRKDIDGIIVAQAQKKLGRLAVRRAWPQILVRPNIKVHMRTDVCSTSTNPTPVHSIQPTWGVTRN